MEVRYTAPQKGYLSDTCAIPCESKANGCDAPLCDTISKGYCAIGGGGVSRTGPLSLELDRILMFLGTSLKNDKNSLIFLRIDDQKSNKLLANLLRPNIPEPSWNFLISGDSGGAEYGFGYGSKR